MFVLGVWAGRGANTWNLDYSLQGWRHKGDGQFWGDTPYKNMSETFNLKKNYFTHWNLCTIYTGFSGRKKCWISPLGGRVCPAQVWSCGEGTGRHLAECWESHLADLRQVHFWREGEGTRGGELPLVILCSHLEASTIACFTYYSRFYHIEHKIRLSFLSGMFARKIKFNCVLNSLKNLPHVQFWTLC